MCFLDGARAPAVGVRVRVRVWAGLTIEVQFVSFGDWFYRRVKDWSGEKAKGNAFVHVFRKTTLQHARRGEDIHRQVARRCHRIIWFNFAGTPAVDTLGMGLAAVGLLNPLFAPPRRNPLHLVAIPRYR